MKTLHTLIQCETEEKKSRFIAHLVPIKDYDRLLATLRDAHPKANHHVSAFRYLNEYDQIVEGAKDDGEPAGTSGPPCLKCLQGADLINVGVIVTRYFGGIKLGTGGLARAYSSAANAAISEAPLIAWVKQGLCKMSVTFQDMSQLEQLCSKQNFTILSRDYTETGVDFTIAGGLTDLETFLSEYQGACFEATTNIS